MNPFKKLLFLILAAFIATSSIAQDTAIDKNQVAKHSHLEYEKSLEGIKDSISKNQVELKNAQSSIQTIRDKVDNVSYLVDLFLKFYAILLTITFGGAVAYTIVSIRVIKSSYENKFKENYEKIAKKNLSTIKKVIESEDWSSKIRTEKKILILNKAGTGINHEFLKVIATFDNHNLAHVIDLQQALNLDFSKYDLVILENYDEKGFWKFNSNGTDEEKDAYKKFIALANKICPNSALIYFGRQETGRFPSDKAEESLRHLISFSNTPSTLYSNIIDLLRYKDIIEGKQLF